ncbi:MAG: hypothetical protein IJD57_02160 [Candidatus Gastranaerophilales bacterium]|nr:hypothetical protein [Candidatus Gastranaerophilales bacterium]
MNINKINLISLNKNYNKNLKSTVCFQETKSDCFIKNNNLKAVLAFGGKISNKQKSDFKNKKSKIEKELNENRELTKKQKNELLGIITPENIDFAQSLNSDKKISKQEMCTLLKFSDLKDIKTKTNIHCILKKDKYLSSDATFDILYRINEENFSFGLELINNKDFPKKLVGYTLSMISETKKEMYKFLNEEKEFSWKEKFNLLKISSEENIEEIKDFYTSLKTNEQIKKEEKNSILLEITETNLPFAKKLCNSKDFAKKEIAPILHYYHAQNCSLAEKLCIDKDFPKNKIAKILARTRNENLSLSEKLCKSKKFPKEKIADFLMLTEFKNQEQYISLINKLENGEIAFEDIKNLFHPFI